MKTRKIILGLVAVLFLGVLMCFGASAQSCENCDYEEADFCFEIDYDSRTATVVAYNGVAERVIVPDSVAGIFPVTIIGEEAFARENNNIVSITLPNTVVSIGDRAFAQSVKLKGITLSKTLTAIGKAAFGNCVSLTNVELPQSLVEIGDGAFIFCASLENIIIPSSVKTLGEEIFLYCSNLKSVEIKAEITKLPRSFFHGCFSLENVVLPENLNIIGENAISFCLMLNDLPYNDNIATIETGGFSITGAKSVVLKNRDLEIGEFGLGYTATEQYVEDYKRYIEVLTLLYKDTDNVTEELSNELAEIMERLGEDAPVIVDEEFVIYGYTGSTAETYANANSIKFISLDEECQHTGGEASCEKLAICSKCGNEYGELADHTPFEMTTQPTCTADGVKITSCLVCGESLGFEVIPSRGHDEVATKNNNGTHTITCKVSGCSYSKTSDCTYGQWNVILPATCTENGKREKVCSVCSYALEGEISAQGHTEAGSVKENIVDATCTKDGSYDEVKYCIVCGKVASRETVIVKTVGHSLSEWIIIKEATLVEEGSRTRECLACPYSETERIEKLVADKSEDEKTGIELIYTDDAYGEKNVEIKVEEDYTGTQYIVQSLGIEYSGYVSFNIKTYVDGVEVQPEKPVLIRIPLPSNFNPDKVAVYHTNTRTNVFERVTPVYIEDGYVVFFATSFSLYTVVDTSTETTVTPDTPEEKPTDSCSCNCHKSGFMGFIWKILRFFYKIFGTNKICSCGAEHY